jgi:hypothetical protein
MATGETPVYSFPYPVPTDPVNVAGDIQSLANRVENVIGELTTPNTKLDVKNGSLVTIGIGDPVFISGIGIDNILEVTRSAASVISTMPAIGIAASTITSGNIGQIVIAGLVDADINTSSFTFGDSLYVKSNGGLTNTAPLYPAYSQQIATVVKVDASYGRILMLSGGGGLSGPITWGQLRQS